MSTRRVLLKNGSKAVAVALLSRFACGFSADTQQQPAEKEHPAQHSDEMTVNSAPQPQHYPPPDFGPPPTSLPTETTRLRGSNSLKAHASRRGLIAGAAVVVQVLQRDPALQELIAEQYGILVPEGELKWRALRPSSPTYDFAASDTLFAFAAKHHMLVRGHTLVWHNSVPDWLRDGATGLDVRQLLVDHIKTVMGRYRGRVHSWDVVNEAILPADGQADGLRKSFWYDAVGPDYIELAYRTARDADPHAKLTYNDYGVEYDSEEDAARRKNILALLQHMQHNKIPIDAVGIQAHIKAGSSYPIGAGLSDYIESIRTMGLEVYLTEMDVNEDDLAFDDIARRDQAIAETYRQFLEVALASPALKLMLTWGVSDRRTWLNDGPTHHRKQPNRPQRSLPFDAQYRPAPAYFAIRDCFDKAPHRKV
jgi:endo-1,4-beta-xylanase